MDFDDYALFFQANAIKQKKSQDFIDISLEYAKVLFDKELPVIYDTEHFSKLVGFDKLYIKRAIEYSAAFYWEYKIPRAHKSPRIIHEPLPNLKEIQLWILKHILYRIPVHTYAKAYIPGKNIKENLRFHRNKNVIITFDINDFFNNINRKSIEVIFNNLGYCSIISNLLSKLLVYEDRLPQGAPTSPYLSNIIMIPFDTAMEVYCREKKILYTRYADDLTYSGTEIDFIDLKKKIIHELSSLSLTINTKKTKVMYKNNAQYVTGAIVNKKIQVPKSERKEIRQAVYYIEKYGLEQHLEKISCKKRNYLRHLLGRITYALFLTPTNKELQRYQNIIRKLLYTS